jgi:hypothetical protein
LRADDALAIYFVHPDSSQVHHPSSYPLICRVMGQLFCDCFDEAKIGEGMFLNGQTGGHAGC